MNIRLFLVLLLNLLLLACASSNSGDVYSRDEARRQQTVKLATVESVRAVKIEGTKSHVGTGAGAIVGGVLGSTVGGSGKTAVVGTVLGAVAGGLAGAAIEEGVTRRSAIEITVRLENNKLTSIVQETGETFNVGDKVRLIDLGGITRVSH
ncbi:MAG: glycine zipper 2TM domain-containing protein [Methylophilaceae bacterium]|nr:glycine zipper 2TM domain-containing protein [Methylophilaceae bacterium]